MYDIVLMRVREAVGDLRRDVQGAVKRQFLADDQVFQFTTFEELHRHVGEVAAAANVVDGDDVGMVEATGGTRFDGKAFFVVLYFAGIKRHIDGLDRHRALEHWIDRAVDHAHRAAADFGGDVVTADCGGLLHQLLITGRGRRCGTPGPNSGARLRPRSG